MTDFMLRLRLQILLMQLRKTILFEELDNTFSAVECP